MIVLTTLGAAEILVGDAILTPVAERAFGTLLYLCVEAGRPVRRTTLRDMIFPEGSTSDGAHSLRQLLYTLRKTVPSVVSTASTLTVPADQVQHDVHDILRRGLLTDAEHSAIRAGYLADFAPTFSRGYGAWLDTHRDAVSVQLRRLCVDQIGRARARHDWVAVEAGARTCLALDPLNAEATMAMSEALAMVGSKAEAVALLDSYNTDVGPAQELKLPTTVLKRRIAERMPVYSPRASPDVQLVGRDAEFGRLIEAFAIVRAGHPRIVRVSGEAGIGKSRLVEEFERLAVLEGARVVTVRTDPSDVRRPLSAFYDAVPRLLALPGALGCAPESMQFLKRFDRLRAPTTEIADAERDAEVLFANITLAIQDLLAAVASESTVLLVIEDAHWLDVHSTQLIEEVMRSRASLTLGLILTFRTDPSREAAAEEARDVVSIPLSPLDSASCERLVQLLLKTPEAAPAELRTWLAETAAGSPLYARLLVQHFEETGQRFEVPMSLTSLLVRQLDELPMAARKVIETATVLGRYATVVRLRRLLDMPPFDFLIALQQLADRRLLRQEGDAIRPAHALVDNSVIDNMHPLVESVLHRDIAMLLESEMSPESAHVPWDAALHWQKAGETDRAITALRTCARQALRVGQPGEACAVLERLGRDELNAAMRYAIYDELIDVAEATGEWSFLPAAVEQLLAAGDHGTFRRSRNEYAILRCEASYRAGSILDDMPLVLRAVLSDEVADPALRLRAATAVVVLANTTNDIGDLPLALDVGTSLAPLCGIALPEAALTYFHMIYHTSFGNIDLVPALATRAVSLADIVPAWTERARLQTNAAFAMLVAGFPDEAQEIMVQLAAEAALRNLPSIRLRALAELSHIALCSGRPAVAWEYLIASYDLLQEWRSLSPPSKYCWVRTVLLTQERRFEEAEQWIAESATHLPLITRGNAKVAADAHRILIRAERGQPRSAGELEAITDSYKIARGTSIDDFAVACIAAAWARYGDHAQSTSIAVDYLTNRRRFRTPVPATLQALADGASGSPRV